MSSDIMAGWRQRRFPPQFRIAPAVDASSHEPAPAPLLGTPPAAGADEATSAPTLTPTSAPTLTPTPTEAPSGPPDGRAPLPPDPGDLSDDAVARIATEVWRAHRRATGPRAQERPDRAVRMAGRHLAGATNHLGTAGITTHDHDGQPYVLGLELVVLTQEEDPAMTRPTITETVRPTVKRAGRVIQQAEVIVGVPPDEGRADDDAPVGDAPDGDSNGGDPNGELPNGDQERGQGNAHDNARHDNARHDNIDFGIDLGTTNSAVAVAAGRRPGSSATARGEEFTPSAVYVGRSGNVRVGQAAANAVVADPDNAVAEFKLQDGPAATRT